MIRLDKQAIREKITNREYNLNVTENWTTPSGNQRSKPMYEGTIKNTYLGKTKYFKKRSVKEIRIEAQQLLTKWNEQEIKEKIKKEADRIWKENRKSLEEELTTLKTILISTIGINNQIQWKLNDSDYKPFDHKPFEPELFDINLTEPQKPSLPKKSFLDLDFIPFFWNNKMRAYENNLTVWEKKLADWEKKAEKLDSKIKIAKNKWRKDKKLFYVALNVKNKTILDINEQYENISNEGVIKYFELVFGNSTYPDGYNIEYDLSYKAESKTLVVNLSLPTIDSLPEAHDYKLNKTTSEISPVLMKNNDRKSLYDSALQQTVIRTLHEIFDADYMNTVEQVVTNGWVTYIDKSTGNDKTSCIISVSANKEDVQALNLNRLEPNECIKSLKGVVAGPLSNLAPVKPILKLDKNDKRFVESQEILADLNSTTNLAGMDWEEFEHLVRELFEILFSDSSSEVKVTQASNDGGIDAIAFDDDPIRGGKFVIQAKRYTKVVPVSAARDLYGSMISEGANKGILVTTSHFGPETHAFIKDKPISLISGAELVYLLEENGYKVRIDIEAARTKLDMEREANLKS